MAEWRVKEDVAYGRRKVWWLMSGNRTLGKIYSERTAHRIVRDHNDMERAERELREERNHEQS